MDNTSVVISNASSYNSNNTSHSTSSFTAKLRRLKIEESIILQNINKSASACLQSDCELDSTSFLTFSEFKKFFTKIRNSYNEMKQLFEDIKASTSSKEVIKSLDIDDIKKSTLELENKIKSFKLHLHTELSALKSAELQLNQKLNDPVSMSYLKRKPKMQTAKYTEIVPSPVKAIMTSPFKCSEVQQFQEFMKNCKNRYGGWDEYHHNIFVNLLQKHFDMENFTFSDESLSSIVNSSEFYLLLRELMPKLLGVSEEDVISHVKWYTKYHQLKDRQQKAIDKWRSNRRMMKPNVEQDAVKDCKKNKKCTRDRKHASINKEGIVRHFTRKCSSDEMQQEFMNNQVTSFEKYVEQEKQALHYMKSTKQWNIRCSSEDTMSDLNISDVDDIEKLCTPSWRAGL